MSALPCGRWSGRRRWALAYAALVVYVAWRMGAFALTAAVTTPSGVVRLPNTFASVDHPFHVARADLLWNELASGRMLRWIGQHQGGYPVEFYPMGEAWLEVLIRGISFGALSVQGAHTLAVVALFLLPGAAFAALARLDGLPFAIGFLALALHVALPGSWFHGGYTELVQWGLVTNVAGAVAALLMLPALIGFLRGGSGWTGALAAALATWAVYCNPRSLIGLAALALGAWAAVMMVRHREGGGNHDRVVAASEGCGLVEDGAPATRRVAAVMASSRLSVVAGVAGLLAAPLLLALIRFGGLYQFVHYSGYDQVGDYFAASASAVAWPVLALGLAGAGLGLIDRRHVATTAAAVSLVAYVLLTLAFAYVPLTARLAPQLEPTRLMPLQRYLVLFLAAAATWAFLDWVFSRFAPRLSWTAAATTAGFATALLIVGTRPVFSVPPDPASPAVPATSLYPVATSAQPESFDLEVAVRAADEAAQPGSALLIVGSALSWHQPLWAPLWTSRPLYYDNWLWFWHADHAGTPGYRFQAGNHYPDPERTLEPTYLAAHGIGAIVVTGAASDAAARSPLLEPVRAGVYDAYVVLDPVTTVTFGGGNAALVDFRNQTVHVVAEMPGQPVIARFNWHPRWEAWADDRPLEVRRLEMGYIGVDPIEPARGAEFHYAVQPLDWVARMLALAGVAGAGWLVKRR